MSPIRRITPPIIFNGVHLVTLPQKFSSPEIPTALPWRRLNPHTTGVDPASGHAEGDDIERALEWLGSEPDD
jgi:hypothetical protein